MATVDKLQSALLILSRYDASGDWHSEHDQSWFPGPKDVSTADAKALDKLGFFWDDESEAWSVFN